MTIQCFALICYRQAGKKSTSELLKSLSKKRINSQNLFSNTNSAVLNVWYEACCSEHRSRHFRPLLSSGMTGGAPAVLPMDFKKSSSTFWSAVEGWCDKPICDGGRHLQTVHSYSSYFGHFFLTHDSLLRKITCEEEWTLRNPSQSIDLALGDKPITCRTTKCSV